jgi:hypothetical protein
MKIDYSNTHTILFVEQIDDRNIVTAIGMVNNSNLEEFADNWEKREKALNRLLTREPEDFMALLRKEFEDIENELRKK